ncbi:MAG: YlxR family protein [Chloroflexota bacterium]|nr:MAG: YlxR family protein [Chloroflexota bacterium]
MRSTPPAKTRRLRPIPRRTCVGCRQVQPKRDLIRIVLGDDGAQIDASGKKEGRGAYLCRYGRCWQIGLDRRSLDHALKQPIAAENRKALAEFASQLPHEPSGGSQ